MKAAFYIPVQRKENSPLKLLIEAGNHSVSFLWYHCEPKSLAGLAVYQMSQPLTAETWDKLIESEPELKNSVDQTIVCFDTRESTLVPASYFLPETAADILHELYGSERSMELYHMYVETLPAYLIYRLNPGLKDRILQHFPGALITHASREQVMNFSEKPAELFALLHPNAVKIFLFHQGRLLFTQYAGYQTASDACYHLLNTCHQYGFKPEDLRLRLSGMLEKSSPLYNEIYACFPDIKFMEIDTAYWSLPETMNEYPGHYFSHLTDLASCVS